MNMDNIHSVEQVRQMLLSAEHAVFFGGAGVSTDSGIPDFRGTGGLYSNRAGSNEYYLSRQCLDREPQLFFEFFKNNMTFENARPNKAHLALADLEGRGVIKAVITQNIDGLHQKAGSRRVIELHGSAERFYCTGCKRVYGSGILLESDELPRCTSCGALVRPDVTLYGEALDEQSFIEAENEIRRSDVLIVGGTSLVVNPAASLIRSFRGSHLIIINYTSTPYDRAAEYVIRESLSEAFGILARE